MYHKNVYHQKYINVIQTLFFFVFRFSIWFFLFCCYYVVTNNMHIFMFNTREYIPWHFTWSRGFYLCCMELPVKKKDLQKISMQNRLNNSENWTIEICIVMMFFGLLVYKSDKKRAFLFCFLTIRVYWNSTL